MTSVVDGLLLLLVLTDMALLGSSRLTRCIRLVAAQGLLLGALALAALHHGPAAVALAAGTLVVKTWVLPWLLGKALREANVRSELEPFVGYGASLLFGLVALGASLAFAGRLPLPEAVSPLILPVAVFTLLVGLFLIVSRKKALTQVLGYLVLENGIYVFGVGLAIEVPFSIELGILLDLVVAVFLMGITLFHINRSFDDIDTTRMSSLKE